MMLWCFEHDSPVSDHNVSHMGLQMCDVERHGTMGGEDCDIAATADPVKLCVSPNNIVANCQLPAGHLGEHRIENERFQLSWGLPEVANEGDAGEALTTEAESKDLYSHVRFVTPKDLAECQALSPWGPMCTLPVFHQGRHRDSEDFWTMEWDER